MQNKDIDTIYDAAVRFVNSYGAVNKDFLCKAFEINYDDCNLLIAKMLAHGAIIEKKDSNEFVISKEYNHSNYLLERELEQEKGEKKRVVVGGGNKKGYVSKILPALAIIVFFVTCYFSIREPMSLLLIIPFSLLCLSAMEKVGVEISSIGVVLVCIIGLAWVDSIAPIFGERYSTKVEYEEIKNRAKKYEQDKESEKILRISRAQDSVKNQLKDASSAKFSAGEIGKNDAVCGLVNAKNSFGAYAGEQRYISVSGITLLDDDSSAFTAKWGSYCQ
ncbi:hypothetical protein [Edaphovirga cremea]|uniref:hypothetical protein n=1 Tax=Edaphovirga cremea TaxID=2267246 RepID=UPI003989B1F6